MQAVMWPCLLVAGPAPSPGKGCGWGWGWGGRYGPPSPRGGWFRWLHVPSCCLGNKRNLESLVRVITMETSGKKVTMETGYLGVGRAGRQGWPVGRAWALGAGTTTLSWD